MNSSFLRQDIVKRPKRRKKEAGRMAVTNRPNECGSERKNDSEGMLADARSRDVTKWEQRLIMKINI
jgi:hypothetical protein